MKRKDVLAILDGTSSNPDHKAPGSAPVVLLRSDEVEKCIGSLRGISPAIDRRHRPVTLNPLQMPQIF